MIKRELKLLKQEGAQLNQKRKENRLVLAKEEQQYRQQTEIEKFENFKHARNNFISSKQQQIFHAEQKRGDMRQAFYHMAVWNVQEAGDIIEDIIHDDLNSLNTVKPVSVAEKVRQKATKIRRKARRQHDGLPFD